MVVSLSCIVTYKLGICRRVSGHMRNNWCSAIAFFIVVESSLTLSFSSLFYCHFNVGCLLTVCMLGTCPVREIWLLADTNANIKLVATNWTDDAMNCLQTCWCDECHFLFLLFECFCHHHYWLFNCCITWRLTEELQQRCTCNRSVLCFESYEPSLPELSDLE